MKKLFDELHNSNKESDLKNISNIPNNLTAINIAINNGLIDHDIEERYNFKPIYAASTQIQGLDLTSV